MADTGKIKGLALLCSLNGDIEQVLRNDFNIGDSRLEKKMFNYLVDEGTRNKSYNFLLEIKRKKIAFDYQLNIPMDNVIKTLYFVGLQLGDKLLIIGADNHKEAMEFTGHLQHINNEQANLIRQLIKEKYSNPVEEADDTQRLFDEVSNLNNELVNLQRELTKKNIELAKLNELKNQFLGMAAHDLRNPLGNIINYAEFLQEDADVLSDTHKKFIEQIKKITTSMLALVNDLLDVSSIESGKVSLTLEEVNLIDLIDQTVSVNRSLGEKKQIQLNVEKPESEIYLKIDRDKIIQVVTNLCTNAIKYSNEGTKVEVKIIKEFSRVIISIADQGLGIEPDELKLLFRPFQTTTVRSTGGEKSTGLGLYIVRRIVEAHEGEIWVESEPGKGSVFSFSLPVMY
ncbi:MAG: HAMP domain-containing histidine kinase [Bacteroidales bacterium]|nr:HAMP domain-containing histidine kinase [Bacteroidales bacterium]MCF8404233.1 HAMP domain-containing histidine kinase [Bacteroidales bacterium]